MKRLLILSPEGISKANYKIVKITKTEYLAKYQRMIYAGLESR